MHVLELLYYAAFQAKKSYALSHRKHLPARVISIGNITLGGTGKTPAVIAVAEEARRRGFSPAILTRGYKGKAKGPCFVSMGGRPLLSVGDAGDEPYLMAERLHDVPIVKSSDRFSGGLFALREARKRRAGEKPPLTPDMFILDDGFQHWGLYRDKDIVLIDAGNPFGNRLLLPLGTLREPPSSLAQADIILLTKCPADRGGAGLNEVVAEVQRYNSSAPVYFAGHEPAAIRDLSGAARPADWLAGKRVFGFCALGRPGSFLQTLETAGADVAGFRRFRDHFRYDASDIRSIRAEAAEGRAEWIVTTEKDIIKIRHLDLPDNTLVVEIAFTVDRAFFDDVFGIH
jgi:tetraacyldisaccharide 4'-kinase